MNYATALIAKASRLSKALPLALAALVVAGGLSLAGSLVHAAPDGFYLTSDTTSYKIGENIIATVRLNLGTSCASIIQSKINYPADLLEYSAMNVTGSFFQLPLTATAPGSGVVDFHQFTTTKGCNNGSKIGNTGDQLIGQITFKVLAAGTASLTFDDSTYAKVANNGQSVNVATGGTKLDFTLTTPPQPPSDPGNGGDTGTTGNGDNGGSQTGTNNQPVISVTPATNTTPVNLPDNSAIEVQTPIAIEPATIQPDGIKRIEYYLGKKLVNTVTKAPYTYRLNTTKLLNGSYLLTSKTYYFNGETKTTRETVIVKNPFSFTQFRLRIQQYAWLVILIVLLIAAAIAGFILKRRAANSPWSGRGTGSGTFIPVASDYAPVAPDETIVTPSVPATDQNTDTVTPTEPVDTANSLDDVTLITPTAAPDEIIAPSETIITPSSAAVEETPNIADADATPDVEPPIEPLAEPIAEPAPEPVSIPVSEPSASSISVDTTVSDDTAAPEIEPVVAAPDVDVPPAADDSTPTQNVTADSEAPSATPEAEDAAPVSTDAAATTDTTEPTLIKPTVTSSQPDENRRGV